MRTEVPAKVIIHCDACKTDISDPRRRRLEAHLILKKHALDFQGMAVASANQDLELCDQCMIDVMNLVDDFLKSKSNAS